MATSSALTTVDEDVAPNVQPEINAPEINAESLLQDEPFMKKVVAVFCDGIFSYANEQAATQIMDRSLRLCQSDQGTLAGILEAKFFAKHTPFYWTVVNRHSRPGIPPLLEKLFKLCPQLSAGTREDIVQGLMIDCDNRLYREIQSRVASFSDLPETSFFRGNDEQPSIEVTQNSGLAAKATFCIPLFFDRLLLDGEVRLTFVAMGSMWLLRAVLDSQTNQQTNQPTDDPSTWYFKLTEKHSIRTYNTVDRKFRREVKIKFEDDKRRYHSYAVPGMVLTADVPPHGNPLSVDRLLQDENRMKHHIATLCDGLFSHADEETTSRIIDESLKHCGSEQTFVQVVQKKFVAKHTPFYWVIVNRDPQPGRIPPLLVRLFDLCPALTQETKEEIVKALLIDCDDSQYAIVQYILYSLNTIDIPMPAQARAAERGTPGDARQRSFKEWPTFPSHHAPAPPTN
ncbi:hypothetical protein NMY22_g19955 [Coprinellus aureogranulatus]|nr:hypothetical protein NMY22_g19955 [Coprinellus aureogranulatus]